MPAAVYRCVLRCRSDGRIRHLATQDGPPARGRRWSRHDKADALFVRFADDKIIESEEVRPGLVLDFDAQGRIVAIDLLDAREQLAPQVVAGLNAA